jgi:hypothetical protein
MLVIVSLSQDGDGAVVVQYRGIQDHQNYFQVCGAPRSTSLYCHPNMTTLCSSGIHFRIFRKYPTSFPSQWASHGLSSIHLILFGTCNGLYITFLWAVVLQWTIYKVLQKDQIRETFYKINDKPRQRKR